MQEQCKACVQHKENPATVSAINPGIALGRNPSNGAIGMAAKSADSYSVHCMQSFSEDQVNTGILSFRENWSSQAKQ